MAENEPSLSPHANQYIRQVLHTQEAPPDINVRYFYTSPLAIDDPLSPLPPIATASGATKRHPPRPFSAYDNKAIEKTWLDLRKKIFKYNEELGEKDGTGRGTPTNPAVARLKRKRGSSSASTSADERSAGGKDIPGARSSSRGQCSTSAELVERRRPGSSGGSQGPTLSTSYKALDPSQASPLEPTTTGTPFIRAPSRGNISKAWAQPPTESSSSRPPVRELDSYKWDDDMEAALPGVKDKGPMRQSSKAKDGPSAKVPVGISRLHQVVMETASVRMEPIYWSPVNDIAQIVRGTWFYKDSMMPVEVDIANMLEAGYLEMRPWTQTWKDELDSAVEAGAFGEMKIVHKLWPDKPPKPESRPSTSQQMQSQGLVQSTMPPEQDDPEQERRDIVDNVCDLIDISTGTVGPDNKAAGDLEYSVDGKKQLYRRAGVIYADESEAYILKPTLQPSNYYGRRPLANYIRKGRSIGLAVVRGFDQATWDWLYPTKSTALSQAAHAGVSTSQAGLTPEQRRKTDPDLVLADRPRVTDLVLVIHGIGQKLSERMETFHFTHAMNGLRREVNVELGTSDVKRQLRKDMGGIMVLPVC